MSDPTRPEGFASHLIKAAGYRHETAYTGAVTLIQRFGREWPALPGQLNGAAKRPPQNYQIGSTCGAVGWMV